ncbi:toxin-antitoxin system HicB family antitoxin [Saccharopolyspora spinosa]|uniref:HicB-like protein involved in pilus formation n=1 Tax=Saccharopolyspora spinosa TaxID=60894 RepID=A0A2N3Y959_SACSN|nr:toxin-antitoxin system HicB family antitoxin [Saccharopolyspora spinosa]PKW19466.1 HicB-like protein involved in pilus formation [Saccharopolyspora spinosa]
MDLSPYIEQLREDLSSAASAGDEQTRQTAAVLSGAIEPAARLAIMNALSDLAAEVTTQLDGQVVDIRLDGRDVRVVVSGGATPPTVDDQAEPLPPPPSGESGDISRITLRLLEEIKTQAEQAAVSQGVSLNTWVAQAVQGALHTGRPRGPWDHPRHGRGRPWGPPGGGPRGRWGGEPGSRLRGWVEG